MTTYRVVRHERDFTQIQNTTLRDERLSFRARGVLAWLLSHIDTWEVSRDQIARNGTEGVTAIRSAQAELTALGYLERVEARTEAGTIYYITNVYESPGHTAGGLSANGSPASSSTANGESHDIEDHLPKDHLEEEQQETPQAPQGVIEIVDTYTFDRFWDLYPRKIGKPAAKKSLKAKFGPMVMRDQLDFWDGLHRWVAYWENSGTDIQFIPHPATFLNQERYNDTPPPIAKPKQSAIMESISRIRERGAL